MPKLVSNNDSPGDFGTLKRTTEASTDEPKTMKFKASKSPTMKSNGTQSSAHDSRSRPSTSTVNKEDQREENGVWFWVNKNGFPVDDVTWGRMWDHVAKIHPDGYKMVATVRANTNLPPIPVPQAPMNFSPTMPIPDRLEKIQNYMNALEYNHTGTQLFEIKKNRPISGLMEVAKDMVRESLPIKCLEAIILGVYLTNGMMGMERFPIGFKTQFNGNYHRHVVLGIYHGGRYGALGMSRREDLMYKPLVYKSLSELITDYEKAYRKYWHDVKKIKIGLPVSHDPHSYEFIQWKSMTLTRSKLTQQELIKEVDSHAKEIRTKKLRETESPCYVSMYSKKSRSWSVPQTTSPRKSLSFVDLDSVRHSRSKTGQASHSSFNQAIKLYNGTTVSTDSGEKIKKKEPTDLVEYQIRI
ncbi:tubulinyl-Tyr carboxypeptidase 2-like isoform X3 [Mya arenaria]|uniref:tubulinyl-Tyr carboxypeptidase 2-like isoform X3 n=1 Tax=Mya arenaria TaxID=6604 RepID=UPI0022E35221|nr:tubulinyl-Tyr carboxypeptidase 2-like isoform X3 [Mya arenaria]